MGDRVKSLTWPWIIPINCTTVDDTWELSTSVPELDTDWRESQNDVQVFSTDLDEVSVNLISAVTLFGFSGSGGHLIANGDLLICWEQVRDFTTIKKIVDIFKECFSNNLSVRE